MNIWISISITIFLGTLAIYLLYRLLEDNAALQPPGFTGYLSLHEIGKQKGNWEKIILSRTVVYTLIFVLQAGIFIKIHNDLKDSFIIFWILILTSITSWFMSNYKLFILDYRKLKYLIYHSVALIIPTILSYIVFYINKYTSIIEYLTPSPEGIRDNIWGTLITALIVIGYIKIFQRRGHREKMSKKYRDMSLVQHELETIYNEHKVTLDAFKKRLSCLGYTTMLSILVYESLNRPKIIRLLENIFVKYTKLECTVGIAQISSKKPLSDEASIDLLAQKFYEFENSTSTTVDSYQGLINTINSDERYLNEINSITEIFNTNFISI